MWPPGPLRAGASYVTPALLWLLAGGSPALSELDVTGCARLSSAPELDPLPLVWRCRLNTSG